MAANLDALFEESAPLTSHGMSLDEAIREYIKLDQRVKETAADRQWPASIIAQAATGERNGDQKTVHMETANQEQKVKVEFKSDMKVIDASEMETVRQLLGDDRFFELFKIEYTPKARALKSFLNTGSTSEAVQTAKEIVKASVKDIEKNPTLSVEKGGK